MVRSAEKKAATLLAVLDKRSGKDKPGESLHSCLPISED